MQQKQKKGKPKEPETVYYDIEVEDWEIECNYGINFWPEEFEKKLLCETCYTCQRQRRGAFFH
jgi:hypothetical protein